MEVVGYNIVNEEMKDADVDWMDYERRVAYDAGDIYMFGIYAKAEIIIRGTVQEIKTEGVWNLASDEPDEKIRKIENDQIIELIEMLRDMGFCEFDIWIMRRLPEENI